MTTDSIARSLVTIRREPHAIRFDSRERALDVVVTRDYDFRLAARRPWHVTVNFSGIGSMTPETMRDRMAVCEALLRRAESVAVLLTAAGIEELSEDDGPAHEVMTLAELTDAA